MITESEVIDILRSISISKLNKEDAVKVIEARTTAIAAIIENQAYRAIGTVEELQKMKADYAEAIIDWRQYKKIGTIERFRELTEKAEPKKPIEHNFYEEAHYYLCPNCNNIINGDQNFCEECGTAIDWE